MTPLSTPTKILITGTVILAIVGTIVWNYWVYMVNPWTRNGQVMAQVIQITPRVTGTIIDLPIVDNQFVKKGDLLFQIDSRTYESTLAGARGMLAETEDEIEALSAQVDATAATAKRRSPRRRRRCSNALTKRTMGASFPHLRFAATLGGMAPVSLDSSMIGTL